MNENRFLEEDFNEFVEYLLEQKMFSDSKEEGIAKFVIDKGYEALTDKQKYVFENSINHYIHEECGRCGLEILWSEMILANTNGGLCSWCQQLSRNDKD